MDNQVDTVIITTAHIIKDMSERELSPDVLNDLLRLGTALVALVKAKMGSAAVAA